MKAIIGVAGLFVLVTVGAFAIAVQSVSAAPPLEIDLDRVPCATVFDCDLVPVEDMIPDGGTDGNGREIPDGGSNGNGHEDPPADEPPADEPPADEPPADEPPADEPPADEPPECDEPPANDSEDCDDCESETEGSTLPKAGTGAAASEEDKDDSNMAIYALAGLGVAGVAVVLGLVLTGRRRKSGVL